MYKYASEPPARLDTGCSQEVGWRHTPSFLRRVNSHSRL